MTSRGRLRIAAAALAALALLAPAARHAAAGPISSKAIVEQLLPERTGPLTRSMSRQKSRGINIEGELPKELDLPSVSLTINFEFDSARLTNDGFLTLRALGEALSDKRLAGMKFQVAGHTDDVGGPAYNQALSEKRAQTVAAHLSTFYGVTPDRLVAVGYGERRPVSSEPRSAANRRVEIINLAPLS